MTRVAQAGTNRDRSGLSRVTIWRLERQGSFPARRRLSVNAVGWIEAEVEDWILERTPVGARGHDARRP
jgi:predicted DNA-binding transcriptional regulator AlpA